MDTGKTYLFDWVGVARITNSDDFQSI